jgi:putative transposase
MASKEIVPVQAGEMEPLDGEVTTAGEAGLAALAQSLVESARTQGVQLTGPGGLLTGLTRQVLETALQVELAEHLGYERGDRAGHGSGNSRNGTTARTLRTDIGEVRIEVPRDRAGTFAPAVIPKHSRRLAGFDQAVLSLYAKGMTTGDIAAHLADTYGSEVSRELVSKVTDAVVADMNSWQSRPLDAIYPVVLIDAIVIKIREGQVANRPVYVAMGISLDGYRDVLGMWAGPSGGEGAKQWMNMLTELRNRGVRDVCIVCCDGLKGLPDAITATWPEAVVQTCVVHLVRNSLRYSSKADWGKITAALKNIYTAPTVTAAEELFTEFAAQWRERYPAMVGMWERSWPEFVPFLAFPAEIRKLIYTTNGIVIWSRSGGVFDVGHAELSGRDLRCGRGYLPLSKTGIFGGDHACSESGVTGLAA